ncbi:hypothetical protein SISSUDRAFT_1048660 [Sistotremastrum suecicum HHB10207 ss-3]|uniref:Uncharacterized protein n=1 Tax=Sistotremastrum suecicum HHB10207 ss-3 TaxID=1314776 RepID=A0A166CDI7_9AGAM|nr:hypothetical protein SISSUDRAFT_1048660 [Sistotremastrum suecicum HHB10207 ss-3]
MTPVSAQLFENLNSIVDELARCNPDGILALDRLIQRLRLAIDPHIPSCADLVRSQLSDSTGHVDRDSSVEGLSVTVDILRDILPLDSHVRSCKADVDQDEEISAAFRALRIAFGDHAELPEDDADFLQFAAQKLQDIAAEKA